MRQNIGGNLLPQMPPNKQGNIKRPLLVVAIIAFCCLVLIIALILAFVKFLFNDAKGGPPQDVTQFSATPSSQTYFLDDRYERGFNVLTIDSSDAMYLGADRNKQSVAVLAGNGKNAEDNSGNQLAFYDTQTLEKTFESNAASCTAVSSQGITYCSAVEDSTIRGFDVTTGEMVESFPIFGAHSGVEYIGTAGDIEILQVAFYSATRPSFNHVIGVKDGQVQWTVELPDQMSCGLFDHNQSLQCLVELTPAEIAKDPEWGGKNGKLISEIRIISAADGTEVHKRRTNGDVRPMSDGWLEYYYISPEGDALGDKPARWSVFSARGQKLEDRDALSFTAIRPYEWGGNYGDVTYPIEQYIKVQEQTSVVVNARGEPVYQEVAVPQGDDEFLHVGNQETAFTVNSPEQIITVSEAGHLVLLADMGNHHGADFVLRLLNTREGTEETIRGLQQHGYTVRNGLFAVQRDHNEDATRSSLEIYLPNMDS